VKQIILDTTTEHIFKMWEISAGSALIVGREVAQRMLEHGGGCIMFTGATASMRGNAGFAAFSSAMARELGPRGIHVAHVIVDGIIDTPFHASDKSPVPRDRYAELSTTDGIIDPDAIADTFVQIRSFVMLANQKKSALSFEIDLRPWQESW
jgi:NAD(P)-dependent dehydrogenase (short-subunit alcohol dehydrogenase family)